MKVRTQPDAMALVDWVHESWQDSILPVLERYIAIPNRSPQFDPEWAAHGHMDRAVALLEQWCRGRPVPGLQVEVVRLPGRTPLLWLEVPGSGQEPVLLYGHLDKQPALQEWADGLSPWRAVRRGDRLYGRGGADDGYAVFASLTALEALARQGVPHARCVMLIEACEESGSPDLPAYVEALADRIGRPSLVVCLDSGCGSYDRLWATTSLRGLLCGDLHVEVLREGVHSGDAGGIVPSSFRILRALLSRLEDEADGSIRPAELHVRIPEDRRQQAAHAAAVLGGRVHAKFPFAGETHPLESDPSDAVLARTWRPALAITGAAGLPFLKDAGNVLRPSTTVKLSLRLPPGLDAKWTAARVKALLETDPPQGARVHFQLDSATSGWNAPPTAPWLEQALEHASQLYFGRPALFMGEGGSIPFMAMLGERFPEAQFLITGVLGPESNAHGPNEFLHLPTAERLTCCIAQVLADHRRQLSP